MDFWVILFLTVTVTQSSYQLWLPSSEVRPVSAIDLRNKQNIFCLWWGRRIQTFLWTSFSQRTDKINNILAWNGIIFLFQFVCCILQDLYKREHFIHVNFYMEVRNLSDTWVILLILLSLKSECFHSFFFFPEEFNFHLRI